MDRGAWWAADRGVTKEQDMTEFTPSAAAIRNLEVCTQTF